VNIPKIIETAFCDTVKEHAAIGAGFLFRPWRSLSSQTDWNATSDRYYPCVDIRCSTPSYDDEKRLTGTCECVIILRTHYEADRDHAIVAAAEEAVTGLLESLLEQAPPKTAGAELAYFLQSIADASDSKLLIGGLMMSGGQAPFVDEEANACQVNVTVHFARAN
jgi:hypothetical protein